MTSLRVRIDGAWVQVGIPSRPIKLRRADGTWQEFGGGGGIPLRVRTPLDGWLTVTTAGVGLVNGISGTVYHLDGRLATDKLVMAVVAGEYVDSVFTDSNGQYGFPDLPHATYEIRAYALDGTYSSGPVTISSGNPSATLNLILPTGYFTFTESLNLVNIGWYAQIGDDNGSAVVNAAPTTHLLGDSTRMRGFFNSGNQSYDGVSWFPVPIQAMRTAAEEYVQDTLDTPILDSIVVNFTISGSAWLWDGLNDSTKISATGAVFYQGPAPGDLPHDTYTWAPNPPLGLNSYTSSLPQIRDRVFTKETGLTIWAGEINDPAVPPGGNSVWTASHTVPADFANEALLYHAYTSEALTPTETPRMATVSMSVNITVDFVYNYG